MSQHLPELLRSIHALFRYCQVQRGERVVVYTDSRRPRELADLFIGVAASLDCDATQLWGETRDGSAGPSPMAAAAMKAADIVFDLALPWLYTATGADVIAAGTARILQVMPPESMLIERPPDAAVIQRARIAEFLFNDSPTQSIRITSELGTDLTATFRGRHVSSEDGVVEKAGEWDSQGYGVVNCYPIEDSAEGVLVLNGPVRIVRGLENFIPDEPIRVTVRGGRAVEIDGGRDARRFDAWFDSFDHPGARVVAHAGFGFDHRCPGRIPTPVTSGDVGSWESMDGGVVVAFGANLGRSGGRNSAPNHCDAVLIGASFALDDRGLVRDGECLLDTIGGSCKTV